MLTDRGVNRGWQSWQPSKTEVTIMADILTDMAERANAYADDNHGSQSWQSWLTISADRQIQRPWLTISDDRADNHAYRTDNHGRQCWQSWLTILAESQRSQSWQSWLTEVTVMLTEVTIMADRGDKHGWQRWQSRLTEVTTKADRGDNHGWKRWQLWWTKLIIKTFTKIGYCCC